MYNKISSLSLIILGALFLAVSTSPPVVAEDKLGEIAGWIILGAGLFWLFISLYGSMTEASTQIERFKEVHFIQRKLTTLGQYKNKVEYTFKALLTKDYPDFEKELLTRFSLANEKDKEAILAMCPQLQSATTFSKYAQTMEEAMEEVKKVEIDFDEKLKEISTYNASPWLWFKKTMPSDIKALITKFDAA